MVFLMVPIANCQQPIKMINDDEKLSLMVTNTSECNKDQSGDMQGTIEKIAA